MLTFKSITLSPTTKLTFASNFTSISKDLELLKQVNVDAKQTWSFRAVSYGHQYSYSGITHSYRPITTDLADLARQIEQASGYPEGYFNHVHCNVFEANSKGIGFHSDAEPIYRLPNGGHGDVAVVSYGGESNITISDKYRNVKANLLAKSGSLYIMQGETFQSTLLHKVGAIAKKRISITFRHIPNLNS